MIRRSEARCGLGGHSYNGVVNRAVYRIPFDERAPLFAHIARLLERQADVSFAYVIGSALTDPAFHDVDVAVCLVEPRGVHRERALALAEELSRELRLPVDIQPLNGAPLAFVFHALRGRLLFSRDDERLASTIE